MYLHGGGTKNIRKKSIIGIFDMDSATVSGITKKYLSEKEKSGEVETITYDLPKSFIVTDDKIYFSALAPNTLAQRCQHDYGQEI